MMQPLPPFPALAHADRLAAFQDARPRGSERHGVRRDRRRPVDPADAHELSSRDAGALKLLRSWRDGRRILYAASYDDMRQLLAFLTEDCCSGNPEICGDLGDFIATCTPETFR